jgi:hypothetical protein
MNEQVGVSAAAAAMAPLPQSRHALPKRYQLYLDVHELVARMMVNEFEDAMKAYDENGIEYPDDGYFMARYHHGFVGDILNEMDQQKLTNISDAIRIMKMLAPNFGETRRQESTCRWK